MKQKDRTEADRPKESEYEQLMHMIEMWKKILNPELADRLVMQINRAISERVEQERNAKAEPISPELRAIEKELEQYVKFDPFPEGYAGRLLWRMRPLIRKIGELRIQQKIANR